MSFPTSHSAHHWNILSLKVFPSDIEVFFYFLFYLFSQKKFGHNKKEQRPLSKVEKQGVYANVEGGSVNVEEFEREANGIQ